MSEETNTPAPALKWNQVAEFPNAKLLVSAISENDKSQFKMRAGDIIANEPNALRNVATGKITVKPLLICLKDITDEHIKELIALEYGHPEEEIDEDQIEEARKELTTENVTTNTRFPCMTVHEINLLKSWNYDIYWWQGEGLCEYAAAYQKATDTQEPAAQ